jgi:IS30 family transposase
MVLVGVPPIPMEVQRKFWKLIRSGYLVSETRPILGVSNKAVLRWFGKAGGVIPSIVLEPSGRYLSFAEREEIALARASGATVRAIARQLNRSPSTISRELRRSLGRRGYRASTAQANADALALRPKPCKLVRNERLRGEVQTRLSENHSPEQISNRLRVDFPDDPEMRVSHEAIYLSLYVQGRGALKRELSQCLRTGRALRKPRRSSTERRGRIPAMVNIADRPAEVEDRAVPGHWEGDLIVGKNGLSAIGTLVERTTRFTMLLHLPSTHNATDVELAMIAAMSQLPEILRRTVTWDQGREMSNHIAIAAATDLEVFFCDPHSPWQRGTNENTNGLLRQYFPKGTDLSIHDREHLNQVAAQLNNRPRKTLQWQTPAEALDALLSNPFNPIAVATIP